MGQNLLKMITRKLNTLNADADLIKQVLDSLILKEVTLEVKSRAILCDLKNDVSLLQLYTSALLTHTLNTGLAWPLPDLTDVKELMQ